MMLERRSLVRIGFICAMLAATSSASADMQLEAVQISGPEYQAAVEGFAGAYTFGVAGAQLQGCVLRLEEAPDAKGLPGLPVTIGAKCLRKFASLKDVSRWQPTGGGSFRLLGGAPLREISNFSPVQDGSGVYSRGGFENDKNVYELRSQEETQ